MDRAERSQKQVERIVGAAHRLTTLSGLSPTYPQAQQQAVFLSRIKEECSKLSCQELTGQNISAQEVEGGAGILQTPIVVFAVDDLSLLRVELQLALDKPPLQRGYESVGLFQGPTVAQPIIGIALEGD